MIGKVPHAVALEETVLGALLIDREAIIDVVDILKPETFYLEQHRLIYDAIRHLYQESRAIDPRMVVDQLRKQETFEKAGGLAMITHLADSAASALHIEDQARVLLEYAMRRSVIHLAKAMDEEAHNESIDIFNLLDTSEQSFYDISEQHVRKQAEGIDTLLPPVLEEIRNRKDLETTITGVPTGFVELDQFLMGLQPSDFVVFASRPGMGKTTLMLCLLRNIAVDHSIPVAFFSLEMGTAQLLNRLVAAETEILAEKLKTGNLKAYEWEQLTQRTKELSQAPIYIDDTSALSLFELRTKCRRLVAQKGVKVVFLDYLQLMVQDSGRFGRYRGNREQEIASISRGLKAIAKELNITIAVASQLSRSVETRGSDKRPHLSDLRESGAIEQDADLVIFPYRAEYYGITQDEEGNDTRGLAEIIIAKNRNGPTQTLYLQFKAAITKFTNLDDTIGESHDVFDTQDDIGDPFGIG